MNRSIPLCIVLAASAAPTFSQSFRVAVNAVQVDVFVGQRGRAVGGLTVDDFQLFDNDVPQTIEKAESRDVPVSLVLTLDRSESVRGERLSDLKSAASLLLAGLGVGDSASLVTFSSEVNVTRGRTGDLNPVLEALSQTSGAGHTSMNDGLFTALMESRAVSHPVIVLFTDGEERFSWLTENQVFETAKESEAVVFIVSSEPASEDSRAITGFYRELTEMTGGDFYQARSSRQLTDIFADILERLKRRYVLTYFPGAEVAEGWHDLRIRLKDRRAEVRARRGYYHVPRK